ncbi:hypothetical protein F5Y10DRAFT_253790 [Nemania abortiva]|nr:hypothetical protein F5Y10DRAFT_253790 [Nemania abortiva]
MSIYYDSELMQQVVTSTPLTDTDAFYVVRDENRSPMMFSIGSDGVLYLTKQDDLGRNQLMNLSNAFQLPTNHSVTALSVYQTDDLSMRIVFAYGDGKAASTLVVLKRINPQDFVSSFDSLLSHILNGETLSQQVYGLLIARGADDGHPLVVAKIRNLHGDQDDICRIDVNDETGSWSVKTDLEMPCNPRDIISLTPATLPGGGPQGKFGLFVLYKSGGGSRIIFTGMGGKSGFYTHIQYNIPVPPGSTGISTTKNSKGRTDLLVAAQDGIHRIPALTCVKGSTELPPNSLLVQGEYLRELQQIHVAQDSSLVSIWTRNSRGEIAYVQFNTKATSTAIDSFEQHSDVQPVLTGSLRFEAMIDAQSASQQLFVLGNETNEKMRVLFQSGDSKLWTTTNFCIPAIEKHREIYTYTTHIKVKANKGKVSFDGAIDLSASSHCMATVNGRNLHLSRTPLQVKPDALGTVTVIQEVDDINVPSLKVSGVPGAEPKYIDPGRKVMEFFRSIKSGEALRNARLPNGEKLIGGDLPANVDLDEVAGTLSTLTSRGASLSQDAEFKEQAGTWGSGFNDTSNTEAAMEFTNLSTNEWSTTNWASFDWLTGAANTVKKVAIEGWNVVVSIGKRVLRFVIKTFEHVMKGIKKVLEVIGTGLKKIWEGLKFLFNWGDILDTHNIYRDAIEGFLDVTVGGILFMGNKVDTFLDGIEESIKRSPKLLDQLPTQANELVGEESIQEETEESKKIDQAVNSPGGNSLNYQAQHNPEVRQSATTIGGEIPADDPLSVIWKSLKTLLDLFWKTGQNIIGSLADLFSSTRKASIAEIVSKLGVELMLSLIGIIRALVKTVMKVGASIIVSIKKLITAEIKIPVISWLWGKISDRPLSVIDAFCLLIAVPATLAFKAKTSTAPKKHESYQKILDSRKSLSNAMVPLLYRPTDSKSQFSNVAVKTEAQSWVLNPIGMDTTVHSLDAVPRRAVSEDVEVSTYTPVLGVPTVTSNLTIHTMNELEDSEVMPPSSKKLKLSLKSGTEINYTATGKDKEENSSNDYKWADTAKDKDKGFWVKLKDAILELDWVQCVLKWVDAHAVWFGIGYGVYNVVTLACEWWAWLPEKEPEKHGDESNPNHGLDPDQSRWPTGFRWSTWGIIGTAFATVISFPFNTKLPSWPLRLIDWGFSWLGLLKHAINQRLRGILTFFLSTLQTVSYTVCWIWDLGDDNAESAAVICNTYLIRLHDIFSGVAMTQQGANIYINGTCTGFGGISTVIGMILTTNQIHSVSQFVIRSA